MGLETLSKSFMEACCKFRSCGVAASFKIRATFWSMGHQQGLIDLAPLRLVAAALRLVAACTAANDLCHGSYRDLEPKQRGPTQMNRQQ